MIELFVARKLAPAELLSAARHLAVCESCRTRINRFRQTDASAGQLQAALRKEWIEQSHLSYEQLAAFVDEALRESEAQAVSLHLADCAACAKETQELRELKNYLAGDAGSVVESPYPLAPEPVTVSAAAAVADDSQITAKPSTALWQSFASLLRRKPLQTAFAGALIFLALLAAGLYLSRPLRQSETAQSNDSSIKPPTNSSNQSARTPTTQGNNNESIARQHTDDATNRNTQHPPADQPKARLKPPLDSGGRRIEIPVNIGENADPTGFPPAYEAVIKQALATQAIARPAIIAELAGRRSNLMSRREEGESFALLNPLATVIRTEQPTFRWQALSEATSYTVYILDINFSVVAKSQPLATTTWTPPQPLNRGSVYLWQVTAQKNGKSITAPQAPMPEARFKILEPAKAGELQRLAREHADAHLILGAIYAHNGLLDEAERELQTAIDKNQDGERAKKLLHSVKAMRQP
jgi:anti-sigma factor RsiW